MTRNHYIEVAEILNSHRAQLDNEYSTNVLREVTRDMALMFKRDNPRFDAGKFFDAAGFPRLTDGLN